VLAAAGPLQAAPQSAPGDALFISPFGEPFRSATGLADWFAGADGDRDGALTLKEFTADGLRFLGRLDADRDGRVDGFENTTYENEVAPEILPQSAASRPRAAGGWTGPPPLASLTSPSRSAARTATTMARSQRTSRPGLRPGASPPWTRPRPAS
jgi:hypothetical protein